MSRAFFVGALALAIGCQQGTFVTVTLQADGAAPAGIAHVELDASFPGQHAAVKLAPPSGATITLPTTAVLDVGSGMGTLTLTGVLLDAHDGVLATATTTVTVTRNKTSTATLAFGSGAASGDMSLGDGGDPCSVCASNALCTVGGDGGATCTCAAGYSGDGRSCLPIDFCASDMTTCDVNASCHSKNGGYTCTCNAGYVGDGNSCMPVWNLARTVPNFFFNSGNNGFVVASGNLLFFGNEGSGTPSTLQSWDVTTGANGTIATDNVPGGGFFGSGLVAAPPAGTATKGKLYYLAEVPNAYDIAADTWISTAIGASYQPITTTSVALLNNVFYWVGQGNGTTTNSVTAYDFTTSAYVTVANYPIAINSATVVPFNGKLYSFAGFTAGPNTDDIYIYDPMANTWTKSAATIGAGTLTSAAVYENKIFLFSGNLYIYDPATDTLTMGPAAPSGTVGGFIATAGGKLYYLANTPSSMVIYTYAE